MSYWIDEALSDSKIVNQSSEPEAKKRLESFIVGLTEEQIRENYLDLAKLFWKMPFLESVQLAHAVIDRYLLANERWSDLYLWAFSALRQVPMGDTVWLTRNYLAVALQALGQSQRAQDILRENWMSGQIGSGTAYEWLTGSDLSKSAVQRSLDAASGKIEDKKANEFLELRAKWLDEDKVAQLKSGVLESLTKEKETVLPFLSEIDSNEGLLSYLLADAGVLEANDRDNNLLGFMYGTLSFLSLDDSDFCLRVAAKAEETGEDASVAVEYLTIAALLMNEGAYVPLAKLLKSLGLIEQATGYANVAVWKDIPGSADVLISLLGLDGVKVNTADVELDEATKVNVYKMASGKY